MDGAPDILGKHTISAGRGVRILPIVHGSAECTTIVRRIFLEAPPALCALELPERIAGALGEALNFADEIPVISLENPAGLPLYFVMEPLEPLVEAARSAKERGVPFHLIDFYQEYLPGFQPDAFPDTYALGTMDLKSTYEKYEAHVRGTVKTKSEIETAGSAAGSADGPAEMEGVELDERLDSVDRLRELYMARQLRNLADLSGDVLCVCGVRHVPGLRAMLAVDAAEFERRFEPEFLRLREDLLSYADSRELADESEEPLEALLNKQERMRLQEEDAGPGETSRAASLNHPENAEEPAGSSSVVSIHTLDRKSTEVLSQPGYFNTVWNIARRHSKTIQKFDRIRLQRQVYRDTVDRYERETGELVPPQREKNFFRFARNWSLLQGALLPDLYRLVVSARAFGNDDFARIMFNILSLLPPNPRPSAPAKELKLDDLFKDARLLRLRLRARRRPRSQTEALLPDSLRKRPPRERYPGEWADAWEEGGICSYPPEDITIENFGAQMQQKATALLRGSEEKVLPFTASLMDGIDYRETIRNYHLGRIFVKDLHVQGIEAGSVVIIFPDDEEEYDWRVVWWGEHSEESDMAFYATQPGRRIIGPGICQSRYGGLMMTYPPGRLHDIWHDPEYRNLNDPADRLLAAAIEYNEKKAVVHLAERPPARRLVRLAERFGQKVVHIPLSTINPVLLARVRRFHVLDSRDRRDEAGDYIF
ncbi:MAG: hypothetical protein NXI24_09710 [bacterium]|nr:hypothetical protein [bacterium]